MRSLRKIRFGKDKGRMQANHALLKSRLIRISFAVMAVVFLMIGLSSCKATSSSPAADKKISRSNLVLSSTTSLQDSGLLDTLVAEFEKSYPYKVKTLALGTGEALAMGRRGEADVLLVHAPEAEAKFVADGFGIKRKSIAYNYFIIAGPKNDPARISAAGDSVKAFQRIASSKSPFISRGDQSGTNKREITIWQKAGVKPAGTWYIQSGQGMGETLQIAGEKQAYTLSDTATFLAMKSRLALKTLMKQDKNLLNVYSVIQVNPAKFKNIKLNTKGAADFARFLMLPATQKIIRNFGIKKVGQPLFYLMK